MAINVVLNGVTFSIPETGDSAWGPDLTDYFVAQASGLLQKSGGTFTLTAEVDFGATYGLKSSYFKSRTSSAASAGALRLASTDAIKWRNNGGGGDVALAKDTSDQLSWAGTSFLSSAGVILPAGFPALTGDITTAAGAFATTLATVNVTTGAFGSSTAIPTFTVNGKGLITAASMAVVIAPAGTLTGTTLAANVVTSSLTSVGTIASGTWSGTAIAATKGGTAQTTWATGDTLYSSAADTLAKLAGNTTATKKFLTQTGSGSASAAPGWNTIVDGDVPTTLSLTTASSLVAVGTITSGTWSATAITAAKGGTGISTSASTGVAQVSSGTWSVSTTLPTTLTLQGVTTFPGSSSIDGSGVFTGASAIFGTAGSAVTQSGGKLKVWGDVNMVPSTTNSGFNIDSTDFNAGTNTGTTLRTGLGATTGNTFASIDTLNAGTSAAATLKLNVNGGPITTGPGLFTAGGALTITGSATSTNSAGFLTQPTTSTNQAYSTWTNDGGTLFIGMDNSVGGLWGLGNYAALIGAPGSFILATNGATRALTLDTSQNATFAGNVTSARSNAAGAVSIQANNTSATAGSNSLLILTNDASRNLRMYYSASGGTGAAVLTNGPSGESAALFTQSAYPLVLGTNFTAALTIQSDQTLRLAPITATTVPVNATSAMGYYQTGTKFVIWYNDAATMRYKYLDMSGTGVTWVHTTTAP